MSNNNFKVLVNAVIVKDDKILLARRSFEEEHGAGTWTIPGGKLEFNEEHKALEKAVNREVMEEVGIEIENEIEMIVNNTFSHNEDGIKMLAIIFLCQYKSGIPKPLEDTIDVKWVSEIEVDQFNFNHENTKNYVKKGFEKIRNTQI